jgi:hypothetical protein
VLVLDPADIAWAAETGDRPAAGGDALAPSWAGGSRISLARRPDPEGARQTMTRCRSAVVRRTCSVMYPAQRTPITTAPLSDIMPPKQRTVHGDMIQPMPWPSSAPPVVPPPAMSPTRQSPARSRCHTVIMLAVLQRIKKIATSGAGRS